MKKILFGVSAATMALLYGLLVLVLLIICDIADVPLATSLIAAVIVMLIQFLISPFLTDLTQKWFYKTKFGWEVPAYLRAFIEEVCSEQNMKYPKIGFIDDGAPNAFTYGHTKNNARIVLTRGIFELLTEDEVKVMSTYCQNRVKGLDAVMRETANVLSNITHYTALVMMPESASNRLRHLQLVPLRPYRQ